MKTSELIAVLADTDGQPVRPTTPARRLAMAAAAGVAFAAVVLVLWLGIQPLAAAVREPWFWMKLGYSFTLALAGFLLLERLARPGGRVGAVGLVVGTLAVVSIGMMAATASMGASADHRLVLWLGGTWRMCSMRIMTLAVPAYLALALGLRRLAPTRLRLAGGGAGLLAGGLAASVYGFYCQESAAPFVAAWYSLGIAACALVGAASGPRLLRW